MELRNRDKSGFTDEIIFVARLPADLIEEEDDFDSEQSSDTVNEEE
jgi:hypothetical protein